VRRSTAIAALFAVAALAFLARSVGLREVFAGGTVVFPIGDPYYHLRRALYTMQHFPRPLLFDPLVSYPDGARIHWPPLHDLLLALLGRELGGTREALERAAAWLPPALGALAVAPIFGAGALLGGRSVGLVAAAIYALLPASIEYSNVGDADHHCTVGLLNAIWLFGAIAAALPASRAAVRGGALLLVALARAGMLLTWPGSLLYVVLADGAQLAVEALGGGSRRLLEHALGMLATAALVAPLLPGLGPPVGGPYSAEALSRLQPTALAALALLAVACAALEDLRPTRRIAVRALRSAALGMAVGAGLLAFSGPREAIAHALVFVGKSEPWAALNAEQMPLFALHRPGGWLLPIAHFGGFGYAIPLVPLVALWRARDPRVRESALILAAWTAGFGLLAALQIRYGNDYAPAGAVGFALGLDEARRALERRLPRWGARAFFATLVAATAGPLVAIAAPQAWAAFAALPPLGDPLLATPDGTLYRFAEMVRAATPETHGFDDPGQRAEYGILSSPNIGHVLHYVARRATTADNFGPYSGAQHFAEARGFTWLESEAAAIGLAERLGARYAVTMEYGAVPPRSLAQRLHREDGLERDGEPRWERFRLVTEGPGGGMPLADLFGARVPPGAVPYKLYEIVPGALLEAEAPPGSEVEASLALRTPAGRQFVYVARGTAGPDGAVQLRVPYPSEADAPVRSSGPWRVRIGGAEHEVAVSESAVRSGAKIPVGG